MTRIGTALVARGAQSPDGRQALGPIPRPQSAFTAQLLAMRHDSPDYRERRRIAPALGVAAYGQRLRSMAPPARGIDA